MTITFNIRHILIFEKSMSHRNFEHTLFLGFSRGKTETFIFQSSVTSQTKSYPVSTWEFRPLTVKSCQSGESHFLENLLLLTRRLFCLAWKRGRCKNSSAICCYSGIPHNLVSRCWKHYGGINSQEKQEKSCVKRYGVCNRSWQTRPLLPVPFYRSIMNG